MRSVKGLRILMQHQRARIAGRQDGTPNLRDFGFDHRAEFEAALDAYHAETAAMEAELQQMGRWVVELQRQGLTQGLVSHHHTAGGLKRGSD